MNEIDLSESIQPVSEPVREENSPPGAAPTEYQVEMAPFGLRVPAAIIRSNKFRNGDLASSYRANYTLPNGRVKTGLFRLRRTGNYLDASGHRLLAAGVPVKAARKSYERNRFERIHI